ncbi:MAG: hypothetical protein KDK51_08915 [Deltaproteobacteria bacterium]|nr:hypothetical protein [Deltaproteobacteria bacterium]
MALKFFHQKNWATLQVQGKDRMAFLQNLLTQDVAAMKTGDFAWSCLLTHKSKLIALMGVLVEEQHVVLCLSKQRLEEVLQILEMYTVIQDVHLVAQNQDVFFAVQDNKLSCTLIKPDTLMTEADFEICRMHLGFPYAGQDYADPIPWEVPFMHQAIALNKGCYVGQETIARLYARGINVNRKLLQVESENLLTIGDEVFCDDEVVGEMTSAAHDLDHYRGLCWVKRKAFQKNLTVGDLKHCLLVQWH